MSKEVQNYKIAIVTWEDIIATDSNWREADDAIDWSDTESGLVNQVGYLLDQDDKYVVLVDSYFKEDNTVGAVTRIPVQNVKEIRFVE